MKRIVFTVFAAVAIAAIAAIANVQAQSQPPQLSPTGFSAVIGNNPGEARLIWTKATGVTAYRVGWLAVDDFRLFPNSWTEKFAYSDVTATDNYTIGRLLPGTEYYFIIGAKVGGGVSWSSWATLTLAPGATSCPTEPTALPAPTPTPVPTVSPSQQSTTVVPSPVTDGDYDTDDDGLIDVYTLSQLDSIRYDLDGDGTTSSLTYSAAFSNAAAGMGCPVSGCLGYELANDLNLDTNRNGTLDSGDLFWNDGAGWRPIADNNSYQANFNGNGYTVRNLRIQRAQTDYVGLFALALEGSSLTNINLVDVNIHGRVHVGALLGAADNATISHVSASGYVRGSREVGGLVGEIDESAVANSHADVRVHATANQVGGLVGFAFSTSTIRNSSSSGSVDTNNRGRLIGGLIGTVGRGTVIEDSHSSSDVNGRAKVGGLVGEHYGLTKSSYATGSVTANEFLGGLAGDNLHGARIEDSYATGAVIGTSQVGGLVGRNQESNSTIWRAYSTGAVTGTVQVGGLIGRNEFIPGVHDSYWDTQTSGQELSGGGTGKTTAELRTPTSAVGIYANWPAEIWDFGSASQYPTLR